VIDVMSKKYLLIGKGHVYWYDIDPEQNKCVDYAHRRSCVLNDMTITASPAQTANYPGLAWDSQHGKVVAWAGGDSVYVLNPNYANNIGTWTTYAYPGGPSVLANGTYKRFSYSPTSKVFVLYNQTNQPGYILRMYDYGPQARPH